MSMFKLAFERGEDSWADYHNTRVWRAVAARYDDIYAGIVHYSNDFSYAPRYRCSAGHWIYGEIFKTSDLHAAVAWLVKAMTRLKIENVVALTEHDQRVAQMAKQERGCDDDN